MLSREETESIKAYLDELQGSAVSRPYGENLAVYSLGETPFAYLDTGKQLLRLSLRCDAILSKVLRERYEEVFPGEKLDKRYWITIVISGQLSQLEIIDLISHSYQIAEEINRSSSPAS